MASVRQNVSSILSSFPPNVKLLAAVKGRGIPEMREAAACGIRIIGENRIQEAKEHFSHPDFPKGMEKHFIGHLQSNKAKAAVELFDVIETVDSVKLAKKLDALAAGKGKRQRIYLEVNIGGEESKSGFSSENLPSAFAEISELPNLSIEGLMGMAPLGEEPRPYFRKLRVLADLLGARGCSMGMSNDWEAAVEEGATIVRIGTGIFGLGKK